MTRRGPEENRGGGTPAEWRVAEPVITPQEDIGEAPQEITGSGGITLPRVGQPRDEDEGE